MAAEIKSAEQPIKHAQHAVKERFVEALFAADWATLETLVDPEFSLREPKGLLYAGIYEGLEGFKACWKKIKETSHTLQYLETVRTFFADDPNHMLCELAVRITPMASGEEYSARVLEQWELRDGKIRTITLYWYEMPDCWKAR